ncbi:MAG: hypothetical protein ACK5LX_07890 [Oscillospiraceae bacterium]
MSMRRLTALLLALLLLLLAGCVKPPPEEDYRLDVTVTYWNGWEQGYESPVEEHSFSLSDGSDIEIVSEWHTLSLTVKEVDADGIIIKTSEPMALNEGGGINLGTDQTRFDIKADQPITLTTPWTDMGVNYSFQLVVE